MKSIFWTFKNKEKIFIERDRFNYVRNKEDYEKLIDDLLQYDAVASPHSPEDSIKYPLVLELKNGFAPVLEKVNKKDLNKILNNEEKNLKKWKKLINKL